MLTPELLITAKLELSNYHLRKYLRKFCCDIKQSICSNKEHIYKDLWITEGKVSKGEWEKQTTQTVV